MVFRFVVEGCAHAVEEEGFVGDFGEGGGGVGCTVVRGLSVHVRVAVRAAISEVVRGRGGGVVGGGVGGERGRSVIRRRLGFWFPMMVFRAFRLCVL